MPDLSLEQEIGGRVAGVDEAGRGPLAGPVVAACVLFTTPPPVETCAVIDDLEEALRGREGPRISCDLLGGDHRGRRCVGFGDRRNQHPAGHIPGNDPGGAASWGGARSCLDRREQAAARPRSSGDSCGQRRWSVRRSRRHRSSPRSPETASCYRSIPLSRLSLGPKQRLWQSGTPLCHLDLWVDPASSPKFPNKTV